MSDARVPVCTIRLGGSPLPPAVEADLLVVSVSKELDRSDMVAMVLSNLDLQWTDHGLFELGSPIEVEMGYLGKTVLLLEAEVHALELDFPRGGPATLTVRALDRVHRLIRTRRRRAFEKVKDSDIVKTVAGDCGLTAKVEPATATVHPYVYQNNVSDLAFLQDRARRIGYEVQVEGKTLHFRRPRHDRPKAVRTEWGKQLKWCQLTGSANRGLTGVSLQGWDPARKEAIVGKASTGSERGQMGGDKLGNRVAKAAFGEAEESLRGWPVRSPKEAEDHARAVLEEAALDYVAGEGATQGDPGLVPGVVLELAGIGDCHSGPYYVVAAEHVYDRLGYRTEFRVRRNALGKPASSPPPASPPAQSRPPGATTAAAASAPPAQAEAGQRSEAEDLGRGEDSPAGGGPTSGGGGGGGAAGAAATAGVVQEKPKAWIEFKVVDSTGQPLRNVDCEIQFADGTSKRARTGADGVLRYEKVVPGNVSIRVLAEDMDLQ